MVIEVGSRAKSLLAESSVNAVLHLPEMTDAEYDNIKYLVEYIGGHWREKYKGFVFDDVPDNIKRRVSKLLRLSKIELSDQTVFQINNQFYPTPDWLARQMVTMANISKGDLVLEPSAGRAAILKYIILETDNYTAVERNEKNAKILRALGYRVNRTSFENWVKSHRYSTVRYDKVVMNPPFGKELDLRHTVMAYNLLKTGGDLVGLVAENSLYYNRPITVRFNSFLRSVNAKVDSVPHGSFKESGTNVDVSLITIHKTNQAWIDI